MSQRLGINGQEPLTYAFKMLSRKEFEDLVFNSEFSIDLLHDLRLLATFGLKDRCRESILENVREIQESLGVKVWLVSGGHEQSTLYVAKKAGIVSQTIAIKSGDELK